MANKTFYLSASGSGAGVLALMRPYQTIPQAGITPYEFHPNTADNLNYYTDTTGFFANAAYPTNLLNNPGGVSADRINGRFEAGTWVISSTHGILPPGSGVVSTFQAHLLVRVFAINALTNAGVSAARLMSGASPIAGSVATIATNADGTTTISATLPQMNLNNEYLVVELVWRLDVAIDHNGLVVVQRGDNSTSVVTSEFTPTISDICLQPGYRSAERYSWLTPSGIEYPLDVPTSRVVMSSEGEGLPPINYLTQRGPFQDGTSLLDEFLQPRIVQLIVRHNYRSRNAYTAGRQALVGILDPHLQLVEGAQQTGTLRKYLLDGQRRDLACVPIQGPNFAPRGSEWQEWSYQEALRFQGFDPVYTNPVQHSQAFAPQGTQLVGPMTGPIIGTTLDSMVTINYGGTWKSYPTFTILGPAAAILIENTTTGELIFINYPLPAGVTMTISLVQGDKEVTLSDGTNVIGYLSRNSDLASWHLTENNGGVNVLRGWASGVNASTLITMYWYDKYLGI